MKNLIEKLYEEEYSPKLTPENLLSNLKLDNYNKINFEKINNFIFAHVFCYLENNMEAEYIYQFKDSLLIKLESNINGNIKTIYCREQEKRKIINQIHQFENKNIAN